MSILSINNGIFVVPWVIAVYEPGHEDIGPLAGGKVVE
jgi:hypothetical protein